MFEYNMDDIYDRFAERTESDKNENFIVLVGRRLCLSLCNMLYSFLEIFSTLGEAAVYGLSYLAERISSKR